MKYFRIFTLLFLIACTSENIRELPVQKEIFAYQQIEVDFIHKWENGVHPFTGAAVFDIDDDNQMEVFVGGGKGQEDALLKFENGKLINKISDYKNLSQLSATYGVNALDLDNDGDIDLIIARSNGLFLYLNQNNQFSEQQIPVDIDDNSVVLSVSVADIDNDGDADLYLSVFVDFEFFKSGIFNDQQHAKKNIFLLNEGNFKFKDITELTQTASKQNTFFSSFIDLDQDGRLDLVLSQNTGQIEIFANKGNLKFEKTDFQSGFGFWMGLAAGDIDNDGDQDLFFSNIGNSIPNFFTKGDLTDNQTHQTEWLLIKNNANFEFQDVTKDYLLDGFGFAWGALFEDLDLDGHLDLLVAQNYIKWPIHKFSKLDGKSFMMQDNRYYQVNQLKLANPYFGQTPIIADFNADEKADVLWLNIDAPARAFLNQSTDIHNYLIVQLKDDLSSIGAQISIETLQGQKYYRNFIPNLGLLTDVTSEFVFGIEQETQVKKLWVKWLDGTEFTLNNPKINTKIKVNKIKK